MRTQRRQAAIAAVLRRKIQAGTDRMTAEIAVTVYDLDEIAHRLAASADYAGLTALIAADLAPARLAGDATQTAIEAPADASEPAAGDGQEAATKPATVTAVMPPQSPPTGGPNDMPGDGHHGATATATKPAKRAPRKAPGKRQTTTTKVANAAAKMPGASAAAIARKADVSEATARRHLRALNGGPVPAETVAAAHEPADAPAPAAPN